MDSQDSETEYGWTHGSLDFFKKIAENDAKTKKNELSGHFPENAEK